jgi:hypothetical protein
MNMLLLSLQSSLMYNYIFIIKLVSSVKIIYICATGCYSNMDIIKVNTPCVVAVKARNIVLFGNAVQYRQCIFVIM